MNVGIVSGVFRVLRVHRRDGRVVIVAFLRAKLRIRQPQKGGGGRWALGIDCDHLPVRGKKVAEDVQQIGVVVAEVQAGGVCVCDVLPQTNEAAGEG